MDAYETALTEKDRETLEEIEVFLRMIARIPADEFERRKTEINEAATTFADLVDEICGN